MKRFLLPLVPLIVGLTTTPALATNDDKVSAFICVQIADNWVLAETTFQLKNGKLIGNGAMDVTDIPCSVAGPAGPQGPAGENGADGVDGAAGVDGATGPAGADGIDGRDGSDGAPGVAGVDGVDGKDGVDGEHFVNTAKGDPGYSVCPDGSVVGMGVIPDCKPVTITQVGEAAAASPLPAQPAELPRTGLADWLLWLGLAAFLIGLGLYGLAGLRVR